MEQGGKVMKDLNKDIFSFIHVNDVKSVGNLIKNGVDINCIDYHGQSPLIKAIKYENFAMVEILIKNGADINYKSCFDETVIGTAIAYNQTSILKLLLDNKVNLDVYDGGVERLMLLACSVYDGHDMVKLLIDAGIGVNFYDELSAKRTPLIHAAYNNNIETVKILIKAGADINFVTPDKGITALCAACMKSNFDMIDTLIKAGADVNAGFIQDEYPILNMVCYAPKLSDAEKLVKLLIENGIIRINVGTENNRVPLISAVSRGNYQICKMLIEAGADVNITNSLGLTPLEMAKRQSRKQIYKLLIKHGARG